MKHRLLLAFLLAALAAISARADSPDAIVKDYHKQSARAVERLNQSLEKAATPLITKLVASGDTAGAELLSAQLKAKLAGESVEVPHASAASLFSMFDEARAKALAPVQKSSIARIDSLLHAAGGPKLETVTELGKVREMIDGGIVSPTGNMPMVWDYFTGSDRRTKQAEMIFKTNGTVSIVSSDKARTNLGRWALTADPTVLKVTLDASPTEEKCEFRIMGNDAELERPVGTRYLRVTP